MSKKVGGNPKFTLNLQQLKAVYHVYEGIDVLGKSQIRNVSKLCSTLSMSLLSKYLKLVLDHLHFYIPDRSSS